MQAETAPPKTWTDERVEQLKALWADRRSASQIADHFGGGMTRNTVIGKLDRLGLLGAIRGAKGPGTTEQAAGTEPPERAKVPPPRPIPAPPDTLEIQARLVEQARAAAPEPAVPAPVPEAGRPHGSLIGIHALQTASCRWPEGDPQRDGFGFCGARALAGRPYCERHARLAYEPPRERRRA